MMFVAGLAMAALGSYQTFRSNASDRISGLEYRMSTMEKAADHRDLRLDGIDKAQADTAIKIDRLERAR